ncbi:MAG: flagellar basal body P-ring formation protein FlgA [Candidatus Kapabacteria bacterium]|nr:flagellar basal body P-ring formation protein FlgA [Candidatus Kapabacteria bacterium]
MTKSQQTSDRTMKYIFFIIILCALLLAETLRLTAQTPARPQQSRFSAATLRIGIQNYLQDRLDESDEYELGSDIQDQVFDEQFVVARCEAQEQSLRGNTNIALIFSKNERVLRKVYVPIRITKKMKVLVLTRQVQRGDVVSAADVEYKLMDITYLSDSPAPTPVGMRLAVNSAKGTIVTAAMLSPANGIQKGDVVTLEIISGGIVVRATGQALDSAVQGQTLRVRRDDSSVILTGIAGDGKTVRLSSSQPSTTAK